MKTIAMKNVFRMKAFWLLSMFLVLNFSPVVVSSFAQAPKVQSITEVESKVKDSATSMITMAKYIIGAVLIIALIGVIYAVASNHPKSKEFVIGWVVAVVVYIVGIAVV
jgi:Phage Coat protein B.